jgi:Flp pilus assembly protein TadB
MAKLIAGIGIEVLILAVIGVVYLGYAIFKWRKNRSKQDITRPD